MDKTFCEVKLFQVKPDKLDEFEKLIAVVAKEQKQQKGCIDIKYLKGFMYLMTSKSSQENSPESLNV